MTNVLGLELSAACALLEEEGYTVYIDEARSIKGVEHSDSSRVIRQLEPELPHEKAVRLVYSRFKTAVN